jgi:nucleoside-diphosphate kinase
MSRRYNLIHGSDSPEAAAREIPLFFAPGELVEYELTADGWIYARSDDSRLI